MHYYIHLLSEVLCFVAAFGLADYYVQHYKKLKGVEYIQFYSLIGIVGLMLYHI